MSGRLGTHSLRLCKTFALAVHEQLGPDLYRMQQALGHANIGSTMHYLPVAEAEMQQAIRLGVVSTGDTASIVRTPSRGRAHARRLQPLSQILYDII
jgi:hypothetical protein